MLTRQPRKVFITGTGTDVGKTLVSAILVEALSADYWKPVQAGFDEGTDSEWVRSRVSGKESVIHPETYKFKLPASPHIAAREEDIVVSLQKICSNMPVDRRDLVIEGAGGLMVPLNDTEFISDLVRLLDIKVILVSRNTLGSINHSLLTAEVCRQKGISVMGWIFNDNYLDYETEIVNWTGFPKLMSIPWCAQPDQAFISAQAAIAQEQINSWPW